MRKLIFAVVILSWSGWALAVVDQTVFVDPKDRPRMSSAIVNFSAGEAEVDNEGNIVITYPNDEIVGGLLTVSFPSGEPAEVPIPADATKVNLLPGLVYVPIKTRPMDTAVKPTDGGFTIGALVSGTQGDLPVTTSGLGTVESPGLEEAILGSDDEFETFGPGFSITYTIGESTFSFTYTSEDGDDSGSTEVAPNGISSFIVATDFIEMFGTGAFLSTAGSTSQYDYDYESDTFELGYEWECDWLSGDNTTFQPQIGFSYSDYQSEYMANNAAISIADLSHVLHQDVQADIYTLRMGGNWNHEVNEALNVYFGGGLSAQWLDAELDSNETFFVPGAEFSAQVNDNLSENEFGGYFNLGTNIQLSDRISANVGVRYELGLNTVGALNLNSGDDIFFDGLTSALTTENSDTLSYRIDLSVEL